MAVVGAILTAIPATQSAGENLIMAGIPVMMAGITHKLFKHKNGGGNDSGK